MTPTSMWWCCFNPLHCGAVVASDAGVADGAADVGVSIPFIAGQWSLRSGGTFRRRGRRGFQSPSLRGSGRFSRWRRIDATALPRFNPLHCGAVVASGPGGGDSGVRRARFNPLHCGAVVASRRCRRDAAGRNRRFNPLHCGAVVASPSPRRAGVDARPGFNPLHCGAVVASAAARRRDGRAAVFQSPSLRGSGRFGKCSTPRWSASWSFNPLHCGAVVASQARAQAEVEARKVSIPFIAGQWSLPGVADGAADVGRGFQSPSLRGSGRFGGSSWLTSCGSCRFQSPSLRGSGRFPAGRPGCGAPSARFNPLHCGAVVASGRRGPS